MTEIFVKIDGVTGTATGAHHGWLVVSSAQLSSTDKNSVVISRVYDRLSNKLFKLFKDGTAIPTVTIDFMKGGRLVTRLELTSVLIAEFYTLSASHPWSPLRSTTPGREPCRAPLRAATMRWKGMVIGGAAGRVDRH